MSLLALVFNQVRSYQHTRCNWLAPFDICIDVRYVTDTFTIRRRQQGTVRPSHGGFVSSDVSDSSLFY